MSNPILVAQDFVQVPTNPAAPPSGFIRVFSKQDGGTYQIDATGLVTRLDNEDVVSILGNITGEPTGFPNRTDSLLSFDASTRTFSLSPVLDFFIVYLRGVEFVFDSPVSVVLSDVTGLHYVYFDVDDGLIKTTTVFSPDLYRKHAIVTIIYYRSTEQSTVYFAEERHGIVMDGATHAHFHTTLGFQIIQGGSLTELQVDEDGSLDSHAQIGIQSSICSDEDITISIPAQIKPAQIPVYYRIGSSSNWFRASPTGFPILLSEGIPQHNSVVGGDWVLSDVVDNEYYLVHILACNDVDHPYAALLGGSYNTKSRARDAAILEFSLLSGLPFAEFKPLATIIYHYKTSFANSVNSAIISTDEGDDYIDWRRSNPFGIVLGSTGGSSEVISGDSPVFIQDEQPIHNGKYLWVQTNVGGDPTKFTFFFEDGNP